MWGQHRLRVRLCTPSAPKTRTSSRNIALGWQSSCWAAEGTLDHSTSPAEPQQSLRTGKQLWKGPVLPHPDQHRCVPPARLHHLRPSLSCLHWAQETQREPRDSKGTLRNVQITTVIHTSSHPPLFSPSQPPCVIPISSAQGPAEYRIEINPIYGKPEIPLDSSRWEPQGTQREKMPLNCKFGFKPHQL